jgi:hypothetical protein
MAIITLKTINQLGIVVFAQDGVTKLFEEMSILAQGDSFPPFPDTGVIVSIVFGGVSHQAKIGKKKYAYMVGDGISVETIFIVEFIAQ